MASEQASTTGQFSRGMSKSVQSAKSLERGERQIMQARENRIPRQARAEIHSEEGEKERTDGPTNECVTRKNLWKIIEFSIAPRRESGRVREGARGRAIFLC